MTDDEAALLVAKVFAMWPWLDRGPVNTEAWVEQMRAYPVEVMHDVVDALIKSEDRPPAFARLHEEYLRRRDKYLPRGLPEPEPSEEERRAAIAQMRALSSKLAAKLDMEQRERRVAGLARTEQAIRHEAAWRDDPGWRLTSWDKDVLPRRKLGDKPAKDAELSTDGSWATIFKGRQAAAIWHRGAHPKAP